MLKSDNSTSPASTVSSGDLRPTGTAIDSLMTTFTIKTAKPWTMVNGFDDQAMLKHAQGKRSVCPAAVAGGGGKRQSAPKAVPTDMCPFALGARRASATGAKEWIESYGLIPNHHFKAQKIIQHFPPPPYHGTLLQGSTETTETKSKRASLDGEFSDHKRRRQVNRAASLPALEPSQIKDLFESEADLRSTNTNRRNLTFHSLEFDNGVLRQTCRSESEGSPSCLPFSQATFVTSEYQQRVSPPAQHPSVRQQLVSLVPQPQADASLEAAHILLDLTRISHN